MIMFNREKRIDFVTGFKKRKDERRFQAKIEAKEEIKQERVELRKTKQAQRTQIEEQYEQIRQLKRAELGLPPEEPKYDNDSDSENPEHNVESDDGGMFEKE